MNKIKPSFLESVKEAENKLNSTLDGRCIIEVHNKLDDKLLMVIESIDHAKFRDELWYSREELIKRVKKEGFFSMILFLDGEPIAYDLGYDDEEERVFFSDSSATLIERKGIGFILAALEFIYCYEKGYKSVKLTTEELDEEGRPLRSIWEKFGYKVISPSSSEGLIMKLELTPDIVREKYDRYLSR